MRTRSLAVLALPLLLTACGPTPPTPAPSDPPAPAPTQTSTAAPPLAEDVLLLVTATATATDGSTAELSLQVHRSLAWNDPAAASLAALMTSTCEGALDASVYEANLWTFTAVDVAATGTLAAPVSVLPRAADASLASSGALAEAEADPGAPHCRIDRILPGAGSGTLVLGIEGDTDEVAAAGNFTRWANQAYGFVAPDGITLSDCEFLVTDAGAELNGGAEWWAHVVDATTCTTGSGAP